MDCFCLMLVFGLEAMHFTFLHTLIKAVTSEILEFIYAHAHKKNRLVQVHMYTWAHTFDSIIIEATSCESGSQEHKAYASFDVSLGFLIPRMQHYSGRKFQAGQVIPGE